MNVLKKSAVVAAIVAPLVAVPTAAFAPSQQVGGGTWNWGNTVGHNYSDYLHSSKKHSSTVTCGNRTNRVVADAGKWSNASLTAVSGCGFYWNNAL